MTTLLLLDSAEQIDGAGDLLARPDIVTVAGTPQAGIELARRNIPFESIDAHFSNRSLRALDLELHEDLKTLCFVIDERYQDAVADYRRHDFRPFWEQFYFIKLMTDNLLLRFAEVRALIEAFKPSRIVCFRLPAQPVQDTLCFADNESLYGLVAPLLGTARGIPVDVRPQPDRGYSPPYRRAAPASDRGPFADAAQTLRFIRRKAGGILERMVRRMGTAGRSRADILVLQPLVPETVLRRYFRTWNWAGETAPLTVDGRIAFPAPVKDVPPAPAGVWDTLRNDPAVRKPFRFDGIDWFELVEGRLRYVAEDFAPRHFALAETARAVFRKTSVRAVLTTNITGPFVKTVAAAARGAGIPVIGTHHGQLGDQIDPIWSYYEFPFCDHYFAYTRAAVDLIRAWGTAGFEVLHTGSPYLERVAGPAASKRRICAHYGLDPEKPLIVYPTISPNGNQFRLSICESDWTLFNIQDAIVRAVAAREGVQIIVKGVPYATRASTPIIGVIEELGLDRVIFANDLGFIEFLDAADTFVIDYPGLTIAEALSRNKPTYVINDAYIWRPEGEDLLRHDVVFERTLDAFLPRLKADLASGRAFRPRREGDAFHSRFVDDLRDGRNTRRAIAAIARIVGAELPGRDWPPVESMPARGAGRVDIWLDGRLGTCPEVRAKVAGMI